MKLKLIAAALVCTALVGCAHNPYSAGDHQRYFLGKSTVTSNVPNICKATGGKYALETVQDWSAGATGSTTYGCEVKSFNLHPEYALNYNIVLNNGSKKVVSHCQVQDKAVNNHISKLYLDVQLEKGEPSCVAYVS